MQIPSPVVSLLVGIAVTLISLWYGQNHGLLPVAASKEAGDIDALFNVMMTIGTGLFLIVEGALIYAAIRFRRREGDETDGQHLEGNIPLEIVWTAIPAIIVLGLSIYSFDIYNEMGGLNLMGKDGGNPVVQLAYGSGGDEASSYPMLGAAGLGEPPSDADMMPDVTIDVLAMQYAFIMTYPSTGIVDGEVHIPAGKLVKLNLKAQDVLHAFWLPEFRIKQDMIPGTDTSLVVKATREGTYPVVCAELCGPYHGGMRTQLIVHSPEDYDAWVQSRVAQGPTDSSTIAKAAVDETVSEYLAHYSGALPADSLPTRSRGPHHTGLHHTDLAFNTESAR
ncbi:MAG: cytochrome c oxidase subunit II [Cyanobacteria bacterium J06632_22]